MAKQRSNSTKRFNIVLSPKNSFFAPINFSKAKMDKLFCLMNIFAPQGFLEFLPASFQEKLVFWVVLSAIRFI